MTSKIKVEPTCGNCYFNRDGNCCFYPPKLFVKVIDNNTYKEQHLPVAYNDNFCGEWMIKRKVIKAAFERNLALESTPITDLQRFIDIYAAFGIELKVFFHESDQEFFAVLSQEDDVDWTTVWPVLEGYPSFYMITCFDLEEKFVSQGLWE